MPSLRVRSITATVSCLGLIPISSTGSSPCWTRPLGWSWTSPSSATYQLPSATSSTGFQSGEGSTSRSPLWSDTAWLVLRRNTWWNCAILLAQLSVENVSGRLLVVTSLFQGFGFRHSAIGPSLSQAPKFETLFHSRLDNRVTIYCFSNRNWKRIYFSSSERFCGSISNEGPYKFPILLLLPRFRAEETGCIIVFEGIVSVGLWILASCAGRPLRRNSVLVELRDRKLEAIHEEISEIVSCKSWIFSEKASEENDRKSWVSSA